VKVQRENSEPASVLEISPLFAISAAQLKERNLAQKEIKAGEKVYLDGSELPKP
jgi:hypothetical protein